MSSSFPGFVSSSCGMSGKSAGTLGRFGMPVKAGGALGLWPTAGGGNFDRGCGFGLFEFCNIKKINHFINVDGQCMA